MSAVYAGSDGKVGWPAIFVGLAALLCGLWLGLRLFDQLGLDAFFGAGALAPNRRIFLLPPVYLVILAADPAGFRQYGGFAAIVLLMTFWVLAAGPLAGLAHQLVWPDRDYFVTLAAFALLAGPAAALCLVAMKRLGVAAPPGARSRMLLWLALSIPGFLSVGLAMDIVDAAGLLADGDDLARQHLSFPLLSGVVIGAWGARPAGAGQRAIIAAVLALAMAGGVAGLAVLNGYFGLPRTGLLAGASAIIVIGAQIALVRAARALTGRDGPWPRRAADPVSDGGANA